MTYEEVYKLYTQTLDEIRTTLYHHDLNVIPQGVALSQIEEVVKSLDEELKVKFEQAKGENNA